MTSLINFLEKHTNKKTIFIGIILVILFNVVFLPGFYKLLTDTEIPIEYILDLKFNYSPKTAYNIIFELGKEGRNAYKLSEILIDTPYALIYGFTYAFIIISILKINKLHKLKYLSITPLLISLFDILENTGIIIMISNYPKKLETINNFTSSFTSLKWFFAGITFLMIISLLIHFALIKFSLKVKT